MVKSEHIHMSVDTIHTGVNVEHCGASLSEQHSAASFDQDFTSSITKLQDTGHACLQLAGIKSDLSALYVSLCVDDGFTTYQV